MTNRATTAFEYIVKKLERDAAGQLYYENEILNMNDFAQVVIQDSPVFVCAIDANSKIKFMNKTMLKFLGYTMDEVKEKDYLSNFVPDTDKETVSDTINKLINSKEQTLSSNRVFARDGRELLLEWYGGQSIKANGILDYIWFLGNVINRRKKTEGDLLENKQQYGLLLKNLPCFFFRGYQDWSLESVDNKIELLTGYKAHEFNTKRVKWSDLIVKEDMETVQKIFASALKTDKSYIREYRIKPKTGNPLWIQERSQIICNDKGKIDYVNGVFFDINDRKQAEIKGDKLKTQLLHAQKMEAVGTLAGGLAHDFNNILQAILGYTQILMLRKKAIDPDYENLAEIEKAAQRARDLINQLLIFGRKVEIEPRLLDLNHEVMNTSKLLERTIPKMIHIELKLSDNLKMINVDPIQLEQIMMNIGINARDAMPDGGRLIFETKNVTLDELYCKTHAGSSPGEYVQLIITDTGHGMGKETLEHIFEPFFTTKELGKGTGLGMAMVYGIVKTHNGYITCQSDPGQGATFKIYFPVLQSGEVKIEIAQTKTEKISRGNETILLVDDDKTLLDLGRQIFGCHGYTVATAECGEEAIEIFKTRRNRFDLVILDVGMPGMGGHKCLEELLKIDPKAKVIITSGYAATGKVQKTIESGAVGFIAKPFQMSDALKTVRKIIDQNQLISSSSHHIKDT